MARRPFDENLAARLVYALADLYPGSIHVEQAGLLAASDLTVWRHAREKALVLVSKDEDFQRLSVLLGPPPKVIWVRFGNCSTEDIARALRERSTDIEEFIEDKDAGFLALG